VPVIGQPLSFFKKHSFVVEVPGLGTAGFSSVSDLSVEIAVAEHWEGGRLLPHKVPGRPNFGQLEMQRGATRDRALYDWLLDVVNAAAGIGLPSPLYKRDIEIVQQERDRATARRWAVYGAFPVKLVAGSWDANSDDVQIEQISLALDYWELVE